MVEFVGEEGRSGTGSGIAIRIHMGMCESEVCVFVRNVGSVRLPVFLIVKLPFLVISPYTNKEGFHLILFRKVLPPNPY